MAIQARLADGRVLNFPDGTDPEVINRTVKSLLAPTPAPKPSALPVGEDLASLITPAENQPQAAQGRLSAAPDGVLNAQDYLAAVAKRKAESPGRSASDVLVDSGITFLKATIGLPEAFLGLADIPTAGQIGRLLEQKGYKPKEAREILNTYLSEAQQAANRKVQEAKGFGPTISAALQNPSVIGTAAVESLPQMLGGAAIARGLLKAAPAAPAYLAGAVGEGAIGAGSAAEQIRQESKDGLLSAKQSLSALGSGAGTALFGLAGGRLAKKLGLDDVETMLASGVSGGKPKSVLDFAKRAGASGITEGVFEELPQSAQEKMWMNYATDKPLMDGVPEASAMGLLTGVAMGVAGTGAGQLRGKKGQEQTFSAEQMARERGFLVPETKPSEVAGRAAQPQERLEPTFEPEKLVAEPVPTREPAQGTRDLGDLEDLLTQLRRPGAEPALDGTGTAGDLVQQREQERGAVPEGEPTVAREPENYADKSLEELQALRDSASKINDDLDLASIRKHFGPDVAAMYEGMNRRQRNKWWDENATEALDRDASTFNGIDEDLLDDYIKAYNDFDTDSPRSLGKSVGLLARKIKDRGFVGSPDYVRLKNALAYAKQQGWSEKEVLDGMRERASEWAGADAQELFKDLFKAKAAPEAATRPLAIEEELDRPFSIAEEMEGVPAPRLAEVEEEIGKLTRDQEAAIAEREALEKRTAGTSLMKVLQGTLKDSEMSELGGKARQIGKNPFISLVAKKGTRGSSMEDMVNSGKLDMFLPFGMRPGQPDHDNAEAAEYIREKLRNNQFYTYETELAIRRIGEDIDVIERRIQDLMSDDEINKELQYAANEQREIDQGAQEPAAPGADGAAEQRAAKAAADELEKRKAQLDREEELNQREARLLEERKRLEEERLKLERPTKKDVADQEERKAKAAEKDEREQIRKESEAGAGQFELTREEGRQDTTGSLFEQPAAAPQNVAISPEQERKEALDKFKEKLSVGITPFRAVSARKTQLLKPAPLNAAQKKEILKLASDALDLGLPASVLGNVTAAGSTRMGATAVMAADGSLMIAKNWPLSSPAQKLQVLIHELAHAVDTAGGNIANTANWSKAHTELQNWYNGSANKAQHPLHYPFAPGFRGRVRPKAESFAQAFSFYFTSPVDLQKNAPEAYSQIQAIVERIQDGSQAARAAGTTATGTAGIKVQPARATPGAEVRPDAGAKRPGVGGAARLEDRAAGEITKAPPTESADINMMEGPSKEEKKKLGDTWLLGRDKAGNVGFGAGAKAYAAIANIANTVLDKIAMKPVSPELGRAMRNMKARVDQVQSKIAEVAVEMNKLSKDEREMISDIIEGELKADVHPPQKILNLAAAIQSMMSRQSQELVELGMLSEEAANRWENKYLPRFYEKKLRDEVSAWAKATKELFKRQPMMRGIKGSQLRARGLFEVIDTKDLPEYLAMGWEQRDPEFNPKTSESTIVWRDYTRAERENMGEIRDAMFRFVMGYNASQRDIALGRLYKDLAENYASQFPLEGYVKVPETKAEGTQTPKYGKLEGMYVPEEVMDHLSANDAELASGILKLYRAGLSKWKEGKTVLNPVSHANNVISNLTMAHFAGVSYTDAHKYAGAVKDFVTKDEMVKEAKDVGLFGGSFNSSELVKSMPPELKAMANMTESRLANFGERIWDTLAFTIEAKGRKFGARPVMQWAYEGEDMFFRYLIYRDARNRGMDPEDARDYAQEYIFTYDDLPKGARALRDYGMPFFSYTYKVVPVLARTALVYPWRYAAPATIAYTVNALMYAMAANMGGDDDDWWATVLYKYVTDEEFRKKAKAIETEERKLLPEWMKGQSAILSTPKAIRMGMDELTGLPMFLDISRIFPGGDLLDANNNSGGVALLQPLTPSNPVLTTMVAMLANKDMFLGKDVVKKTDTDEERAQKRAAWLWKQMTPAISVGNYHFDRAMSTISNMTGEPITIDAGPMGTVSYTGVGKDGLPVQPKHAMLQTMGIKIRPYDLELSRRIEESNRKQAIREIDFEINRINRQEGKNVISAEAARIEREKLLKKKGFIAQGLTPEGKEKK